MASSSNSNLMQSREGVSQEAPKESERCVTSDVTPKRPKWLPDDWEMEVRTRRSGKSAGMKDRYYYDPKFHRCFRSKKDVENFIQTGTIRRNKSRTKASSNENPESESFDFKNCPTKVSWVLSSFAEKSWTPHVNNEALPKSTWNSWAVAMEDICGGAYKS
ncbi:hypothetical protein MRB53_001892 [Persea americana]|uniref:Uncharacterized protein n=1 Tax=Persea americana TaxID=3435 RepID=A0ACC2MUL5_PERAE|nr:hypothetical protein MRB53_001892 [Persea americana]